MSSTAHQHFLLHGLFWAAFRNLSFISCVDLSCQNQWLLSNTAQLACFVSVCPSVEAGMSSFVTCCCCVHTKHPHWSQGHSRCLIGICWLRQGCLSSLLRYRLVRWLRPFIFCLLVSFSFPHNAWDAEELKWICEWGSESFTAKLCATKTCSTGCQSCVRHGSCLQEAKYGSFILSLLSSHSLNPRIVWEFVEGLLLEKIHYGRLQLTSNKGSFPEPSIVLRRLGV